MINRRDARPTRKPTTLRARPEDRGSIYDGTVGYNDGSPHYDLQDGGVALVKVTLFQGHNPVTEGVNTDPSRARGRRVLVRFDPTGAEIPHDGEHVIVAYPAGRAEGPGCGYIIGRPKPDPKWVPNRQAGEKIIFGPKDSFIRFKADGSIFAFVKDGDGENAKPVYWKLHKDGFEVRHKHGRMRCDSTGFEMAHSSGAAVSGGSLSGVPLLPGAFSSFVNLRAAMLRLDAAAISFGSAGGTAGPVVLYDSTLPMLTSVSVALTGVTAALTLVLADLALVATALLGKLDGVGLVTIVPTSATAIPAAAVEAAAVATALGTWTTVAPSRTLVGT